MVAFYDLRYSRMDDWSSIRSSAFKALGLCHCINDHDEDGVNHGFEGGDEPVVERMYARSVGRPVSEVTFCRVAQTGKAYLYNVLIGLGSFYMRFDCPVHPPG